MDKKQTTNILVTAALSSLLLAGGVSAKQPAGNEAKGECHGINSCKGKGECGGKGYSCAGKNSCKGKGWIQMTEKECSTKGGTFKKLSM